MPHEVETMTFDTNRGLPWHISETGDRSVGRDGLATAETLLVAGGLDWLVEQRPMFVPTKTKQHRVEVPGWVANVRDKDDKALGVVRPSYNLLQNGQMLEFGETLVDSGAAKWDTAGSLRGGQMVFASMVVPDGVHVAGDDSPYDTYLLLTNGHDGFHKFTAVVTVVRGVCMNTVSAAIKGARHRFAIKHNATLDGRIAEARRALGITFDYLSQFEVQAAALVGKTLTERQVEDILKAAFPYPDDITAGKFEMTTYKAVFDNWKSTETLDDYLRRTGWGLFNATAEYLDPGATYRGGRRVDAESARAEAVILGRAAEAKDRVLDLILKA